MHSDSPTTRRDWFKRSSAALAITAGASAWVPAAHARSSQEEAASDTTATQLAETAQLAADSPIRQSLMGWCFSSMPPAELAVAGRRLGLVAMEGIGAEHYPAVKAAGLEIALVSSHGFAEGPTDRENHPRCVERLREGIRLAVQFGSPSVITFTGMRVDGMRDEVAKRNCVECWKQVIEEAEEQGINLCLEHLNSRDDSHPMKGHPGYFGDDVELCVDIIREVDSPRMKLLFDIYHVQIMHGDVIRRLRQYQDVIGHYHTAGNPGRGELDETQEINYPAVMRAIRDTGYTGFVAQEFIPTWKDPLAGLAHAIRTCAVGRE